ncbi:MAG: bifunctional phosphopantothenoylcysteine decarboxylase/phosphopantothenate--cysteine ligase CoaBC [Peptostreptococcus anaerobius]|uniref:bifunctional phosphopantothenoylcysteine decarboxylase/phosphopantothenate--cysteine ligase CoaBC n=1 Tax=Peptostreptococcus anaerobius TaxID=1261 RepID=UPI0003367876|nr:bifunctional phosphopantothenoylcysteine decarboxylase/phosphopantothenate--cysteine ligase CoaBC [Peptostreptococcus anaerobius]MDU5095918.1 bifunctional phosphopantothenoylcysteine decarboxylase/phosphopantothenate--cysteine ligase CoaBC [Peptostreptococcus anaerobius]MDU5566963.1 bifunctional phosphopantothenoylcysteine decarboxylase/phosphopantothenate--cysteine ligase CoaBC [Peptostreptococcus anaerobius]CCY48810.1 phosphopantothenoylcysteine decarboxylase/phosphopantothenate--cysteine l
MLENKTIVVGVTGGIAAYKACDVVSRLRKLGSGVHVIMTQSACEFVAPLTLQTLSNNFVIRDMFQDPKTWEVEHIELAKAADLFLIVPATANFIGKIASGIADDMLTTTVMATRAKCIIAPAMNTNMYSNPIVQDNIDKLRGLGYGFIEPASGLLACGDTGKGKLADVDTIIESVEEYFEDINRDLEGIRIIVTAGPTIEAIDPVRYITNRSSGKMGYSIASQAVKRGARVTLVSGKTNLDRPKGLEKLIEIESANDLYKAMMSEFDKNDVVIQSAAVADYKPKSYSDKKIKKSDEDLLIRLDRNKDVAKELGKIKKHQVLVGFAAETNDLLDNASAKIKKKNLDFIVANDLTISGAGFGTDTNIVKLIDSKGDIQELPKCMKTEVADHILDKVKSILETR